MSAAPVLVLEPRHLEHREPLALFVRDLPHTHSLSLEELRAHWDRGKRLYSWDEASQMWLFSFRRP